jgi:hypothetical protein
MLSEDRKRLAIMIGGGVVVLVLAIILALVLTGKHKDDPPMNTAPTGLQVEVNESPNVNTQKSLRCFVNGEYVGQFSLKDCAKKNGVAAQSLDVGLDDNGQLAAAPTASLAPPPAKPIDGSIGTGAEVVPSLAPAGGPTAACLRYSGDWHQLSDALTLGQCVHILYNTRCESPGSASYGRWGEQTLRLVPGRVEISSDNRTFKLLVTQDKACNIAQ